MSVSWKGRTKGKIQCMNILARGRNHEIDENVEAQITEGISGVASVEKHGVLEHGGKPVVLCNLGQDRGESDPVGAQCISDKH